jgi:serine/threonine-protein kinase
MLGRYELLEQVGSGGMAVVYRGRDSALDREVAVKLLHPHLASAPESRARFSREARAVARLAHPGIVEIYDYSGDAAAESYLVTEFVRGPTLRAFAQDVGFGFPEVAMLVGRALADALAHAHSAAVIHRDLKPENVLVRQEEPPAVKLADFGIARILASDERMTMTGALVGSPHHMAPEIVEGEDADARSDVFSLGTILYWLATGKLPFAAPNPTAILRRVLEGDVEDPRLLDARVPDPLADLVLRCLAVDPAARPGRAVDVRDALDRVLAQVGIDRPEDALVAFLRDPAGFRAAFPARAVATLTALGDGALVEGASARALDFFNRVLMLEPGNEAVLAKLARLTRRRRTRRIAAWAGGGLAAALAAALASAALLRAAPAPQPGPSASATAAGAPAAVRAAPGTAPADAAPPAPATGSDSAAAPPPVVARSPEPSTASGSAARRPAPPPRRDEPGAAPLSVYVRPYAHRALLDGIEVSRDEQVVRVAIAPGRPHELRIEHGCCAPFVRTITTEQAAAVGELRVSLEPRPARLRVEGDPTTRVFVEDRPAGTAGSSQRTPIPVPVPPGGDNPYEGTARIRLELAGMVSDLELHVRAGDSLTVAAPRPPPPPPAPVFEEDFLDGGVADGEAPLEVPSEEPGPSGTDPEQAARDGGGGDTP